MVLVILGFSEFFYLFYFNSVFKKPSSVRRSGVTLQTVQVPQPRCFCPVSMLFVMSSRFFFSFLVYIGVIVCVFSFILIDIEKQCLLQAGNDSISYHIFSLELD